MSPYKRLYNSVSSGTALKQYFQIYTTFYLVKILNFLFGVNAWTIIGEYRYQCKLLHTMTDDCMSRHRLHPARLKQILVYLQHKY